MELNWAPINGSTHVGKRCQFFESLSCLKKPATANWDLDKLRVELGSKETSNHIRDLGNEIGLK